MARQADRPSRYVLVDSPDRRQHLHLYFELRRRPGGCAGASHNQRLCQRYRRGTTTSAGSKSGGGAAGWIEIGSLAVLVRPHAQAYSNISFHLSLCANVGQSRPFLRKLLTGETALAGSAMAGPQTFAVAESVFGDLRM